MTIGEPVRSLVESVLNDEWNIRREDVHCVLLDYRKHNLELDLFKTDGAIRLTTNASEWMTSAEKRYAEECLNDWWALKRKAQDADRQAVARNKFMCLVKETNG